MSNNRLTRDNPLLSRPKIDLTEGQSLGAEKHPDPCEINFTIELPEKVAEYVEQGLAENTKRAYASDWAHFEAWGGCIPANDATVATYLADYAEELSVATLCRRLATISKAHTAKGLLSPTSSEIVRATIRGIKRSRGRAQTEAKPLLRNDLFIVLERMGNDIRSVRDRALLLVGFAGAFRRSELAGLDVGDIEHFREGIVIRLRKSKTDQEGIGRKVAIPTGRTCWCPVNAFDQWLTRSGINQGAIFRPIDKHGHVAEQRLSGEAVSIIVKERAEAAGLDPLLYSGHSLRAGLATSAIMAGASTLSVRRTTGHASDAMLSRYVRTADLFADNAAASVL